MEKFKIIQPSIVLAPYVKHYWLLESDNVINSQRIIPTGNVELTFHRGAQMKKENHLIARSFLSGQTTSFSNLTPTGFVCMIAVVFQPFGAKAFFKIPIDEFSGLLVSADELGDKSLQKLEERILNTFDDTQCISLIENFLINRLNPFKEYNYQRLTDVVRIINNSKETISVSQLSEIACLSDKQFQRIFKEHVGATPKDFIRIVRFHKALYTLQNNPLINFTQLAYDCGYYDQSHMVHEFKQFSGYSPREYVAVCAPYSDYFSL